MTVGEIAKPDKRPTSLRYRIRKGFDERIGVGEDRDNVSVDKRPIRGDEMTSRHRIH